MALLHTDVQLLSHEGMGGDFRARFQRELLAADSIRIASGYASNAALYRLDELIHQPDAHIKHIRLTLGMYSGRIPASIYYAARQLNQRWRDEGIGEIRLVRGFQYHGKSYLFAKEKEYRKGKGKRIEQIPFSGFVGSHNLSALAENFDDRNQYELSIDLPDQQHRMDLFHLIRQLENDERSTRIDLCNDLQVYRHHHTPEAAPTDAEQDEQAETPTDEQTDNPINEPIDEPIDETGEEGLPLEDLVLEDHALFAYYQQHRIPGRIYDVEVKVPVDENDTEFVRSNINTCYSAPRSPGQNRDWYEMQISIDSGTPAAENLPAKDDPLDHHCFYLVTDEDQLILAHRTSGDYGKNLSAVGSDRLLGIWFKDKFRRHIPGLEAVTGNDRNHPINLITSAMVDQLGLRYMRFAETDQFIRISPATIRDSRNHRPYAHYEGTIDVPVWTLTTIPEQITD